MPPPITSRNISRRLRGISCQRRYRIFRRFFSPKAVHLRLQVQSTIQDWPLNGKIYKKWIIDLRRDHIQYLPGAKYGCRSVGWTGRCGSCRESSRDGTGHSTRYWNSLCVWIGYQGRKRLRENTGSVNKGIQKRANFLIFWYCKKNHSRIQISETLNSARTIFGECSSWDIPVFYRRLAALAQKW